MSIKMRTQKLHEINIAGEEQGFIVIWQHLARKLGTSMPKENQLSEVTTQAEVNHGRWIARCPFCLGAELLADGELIMYCCSCGNSKVGGAMVRVIWPMIQTQIAIERALSKRLESNQNWLPTETIADLERENKEHRIE